MWLKVQEEAQLWSVGVKGLFEKYAFALHVKCRGLHVTDNL